MTITTLIRSVHGRSTLCEYQGDGFKLNVYLRHNIACKKEYGEINIAVHCLRSKGKPVRKVFTDYLDFRKYRISLETN